MKQNKRGITLIELLVAVAIVMIIAVIAFPAYQSQVEKSRRTDARAALSNIQLAQERAYTVNGRYASSAADLSLAAGLTAATNTLITSEQGFYNITLTANNTAFTANAAAVGPQGGDTDCDWMMIDHLGTRTATNTALCW